MISPRTPAHYLEELFSEAREADFAAIAVGSEAETRFVWSSSDDPEARLEALISSGGKPVAILGADIVGNAFIYRLNPFPEYEDNTWARPYLAVVGERVAGILEQRVAATRN